jgi:hypothetical protein
MLNRNLNFVTRLRYLAYYKKPAGIHPLSEDVIPIESHHKFGYKQKKRSLEEIEYIRRKSELEESVQRWKMADWNLKAEINSFIHRINICENQTQFDQISGLLNYELNPTIEENKFEKKINFEKFLSLSLDSILDAPSIVKSQLVKDLLDDSYCTKIAKSIGFVDLIQLESPTDEIIGNKFRDILEVLLSEKSEIKENVESLIKDLFFAEIITCHNLITKWKYGWDYPIQAYQDITNQTITPRLVKSIGQNSPMPTYIVALFDSDKNLISKSIGESPELAAEDAARIALQNIIFLKKKVTLIN